MLMHQIFDIDIKIKLMDQIFHDLMHQPIKYLMCYIEISNLMDQIIDIDIKIKFDIDIKIK